MRRTKLMVISFSFLILSASYVEASSPALSIITPRGVQRGTDAVMTFRGARLQDALEVFFYQPGFTVTKLEAKSASLLLVHVKVAPDCRLGEHIAQVRTKSGISEFKTFYVGALPSVAEKEPNSDFSKPQPIAMNVTVTGVVQNEDVDYYSVQLKKGQRISVEVEGMRLGTAMFDPYIAILDNMRFELAAADDSPLVKQDAVASAIAPKDGTYIVEVRESAYAGNGNCRYRLHVGHFPRPTAVYPAGGKIGTKTAVTFIGDSSGPMKTTLQLPTAVEEKFGITAKDSGGVAPSENVFRLSENGNILEKEPNDNFKTATPATLPLAFNGIIEKLGDVDFFKFAAKKGQVFDIECYGRRLRSPLDSVMNLYYANGKSITGNDDSRGPDSFFRVTIPADGEYCLRIADHLKKGGSNYVYRVEFHPVQPRLTLGIPRVARYSQSRQTIYVARGNRFATLINASRANFGGELVLEPKGLPKGMTMVCEPMASNLSSMPVVFEAAADAPLSGKLVDFTARHADPKKEISGGFHNRADLIRAGPGQSIYWTADVDRLAIAVIDKLPFKLEIQQPKVPLVRNGSMQLKIIVHREKGFNSAITIQFPFRPPGVSGNPRVTIPAGKNEVLYPINANGGAQIKKWRVYVLGSANVGGTAWVSSQLATLEVAAPYVSIAMGRTATDQGQPTEVVCKLTHSRPFPGKAKVRLLGLPHKVTAPEIEITKDTKEIIFQVTTDKTSPVGRHKNIFCQVIVTENNEPIVHRRVGGTELRIDKPIPKPKPKVKPKPQLKKAVKKAPVKKPPVKKKPPRRLTRLEKLRLEAKKRQEERQKKNSGQK